ncbi:MAG: hypothetical protein ACOC9P_00500 [bacterium]
MDWLRTGSTPSGADRPRHATFRPGMRPLMAVMAMTAVVLLAAGVPAQASEALATFELREPVERDWPDALIHFALDADTAASPDGPVHLVDEQGRTLPAQLGPAANDADTPAVWTVLTLEAGQTRRLSLHAGDAPDAETAVHLEQVDTAHHLSNRNMAIRLPQLPGELDESRPITNLPAPFTAVRRPNQHWLGGGEWINEGQPLHVTAAHSRIVERGPVRITLEQTYTFQQGGVYTMRISLAVGQDVAHIVEHTDINAPDAAFRLSMRAGLEADHVFWHNQRFNHGDIGRFARVNSQANFEEQQTITRLRPWNFHWQPPVSLVAGFHQAGRDELVGVLMCRPSQWSPGKWAGFKRTQVPVVAGPGPRLDMTFGLLATDDARLRRQWAITVGSASEHVDTQALPVKLRRQLSEYSEMPLDRLIRMDFDHVDGGEPGTRPAVFATPDELARVRRQVDEHPQLRAHMRARRSRVPTRAYGTEHDAERFLERLRATRSDSMLISAYVGSDDPLYARLLAIYGRHLAERVQHQIFGHNAVTSMGVDMPWFAKPILQLAQIYDLVGDHDVLSDDDRRYIRHTLILAAHMLDHPDCWNPDHGLATTLPNMHASVRAAIGKVGLVLHDHPHADQWIDVGVEQIQTALERWIEPTTGAWIEAPHYQTPTLAGLFPLADGIRRVRGENHFDDPRLKKTMDYFGFILTPPDPRFPPDTEKDNQRARLFPANIVRAEHAMTLPSLGDTFSGTISPYNGWMARAMAEVDPDFSARQQFYWQQQHNYFGQRGDISGITPIATNIALPAKAPVELDRGYPRFGSVMRNSWTDPRATYLLHRTGDFHIHYHTDYNSFVFYGKGSPLALDFGNNGGKPNTPRTSFYHNRLSLRHPDDGRDVRFGGRGSLVAHRSIRHTAAYSHGRQGVGPNTNDRHMLFLKSDDLMGANYVVIRDQSAVNRNAPEHIYFNLWSPLDEPLVQSGDNAGQTRVHFPQRYGVAMDVHFLSPATVDVTTNFRSVKSHIYHWRRFEEAQHGIHVRKDAEAADFLTVLYPRAPDQPEARIQHLPEGRGLIVEHMEGRDTILLAGNDEQTLRDEQVRLQGTAAFSRQYHDGRTRLAVLRGEPASVSAAGWTLQAAAPCAIEVDGPVVRGEAQLSEAQLLAITPPDGVQVAAVSINGQAVEPNEADGTWRLDLAPGDHRFELQLK